MGSMRVSISAVVLICSGWAAAIPAIGQKRVLTLRECIEEGVRINLNLQIEQANYESNLLNVRQTQFSRMPTLNLAGTHGYSFGRSIDPFTNQFINQRIQSNNFSANLNFPIWAGFQVTNSVRRSKAASRVKGYQNAKLKNDLTLNIINSYLAVLTNKLIYKNTQLRLAQSKDQLAILNKQYKAGRIAFAEIDRYNAQILTEEVSLAQTNQNLQNSLITLKYLVLQYPDQEIDIEEAEMTEPDSSILTQTADQIQEQAFSLLPEIKAANEQILAQTYAERVARGALYPTLSFGAQGFTGYSSARKRIRNTQTTGETRVVNLLTAEGIPIPVSVSLFENQGGSQAEDYPFVDQVSDNLSQAVNIQLSIPILNGLRARTNYDLARINARVARLAFDQQKRTTSQEIHSAYQTARTNKTRYYLARRQVEAQKAVYRNAQARFEAGRSTSFETTTEKNNLTLVENDLLRTTIDYLFSIKLLEFYTGQLQP